jgi:nitrite reductase/ring-hydroxylating ferredoxin subunit
MVAGKKIAIFNAGGRLFAIGDECPHVGGSLAEGTLDGNIVACPWHFAEFDITCGKVLSSPATEDVPSYPVFVNGNSVEVEL